MTSLLKNVIYLKNINVQRFASLTFTPRSVLFSSDVKDGPVRDIESALLSPTEKEQKKKLLQAISVNEQADITPLTGVPEIHTKSRTVRIHTPSKNAMQSGTENINFWRIEFDNRDRWENPLMGWTSTGDPLSNMQVEFPSKEAAADFCNKNGWKWYVDEYKPKEKVAKPYALNFHWNRKTRVSTK